MFQDLDSTLQHILDYATAPLDLRNADVSFITPDKNFSPNTATLNLFLFSVTENREQRDPEPIIEMDNTGAFVRRKPPIRVDCTYLVTAWSHLNGSLKIQEEHKLLALALAWISRYTFIPDWMLQGSLTTQPVPPPVKTAQVEERINLSEFWNALGIAPRAAFTVTVTISMELNVSIFEGEPVVTKEIKIHKLTAPETLGPLLIDQFEIAGTVSDSALHTPIKNAVVTIVELGWTFTTLDDGHFTFSILEAGNFNLQVTAAGYSTANLAITVPGTVLDSYDIQMTP
jgi:hypothetical protein